MPDNTLQIILKALGGNQVKRELGKIGTAFKGVQGAATRLKNNLFSLKTAFVGLGASLALKNLTSVTADFESALIDMGKVTSREFSQIKKEILDLPAALGSSTELMQGYYQVISAGVTDTVKALETLVISSMAAKSAHTDQAAVIKGLTKLMAGYEGEIEKVSDAADLLFAIEKEGQTSFQELIPVIGGMAKLSKDLGIKNEELGASFATITQVAGSTAEAATQYEAVLMGLSKSIDVTKIVQEKWGYTGIKAAIQQKGFVNVLRDLKSETDGTAESMAELLGRAEAVMGVSALAARNFETLSLKIEAISNKTGLSDKAFKEYKTTLKALWNTFKNTIGKIAISVGVELSPVLKSLIEDLIAVGNKTLEWIKANKELIEQKVPEYVEKIKKGFKGIKEAAEDIWDIISREPEIIKFGIIGLLLWGKKGAVVLGGFGHMWKWAKNLSKALHLASQGIIDFKDIATANFEELDKLVEDGNKKLEKRIKEKNDKYLKERGLSGLLNQWEGMADKKTKEKNHPPDEEKKEHKRKEEKAISPELKTTFNDITQSTSNLGDNLTLVGIKASQVFSDLKDKGDELKENFTEVSFTLQEELLGQLEDADSFREAFTAKFKLMALDAKSIYQSLSDEIGYVFDQMEYRVLDFLDYTSDKFLKFGNLVESIFHDIYMALQKALVVEPFVNAVKGMDWAGIFKSSSSSGPALVVQSKHQGGRVLRYHGGGLADNERLTINKVGERYITAEQNQWLTNLGRLAGQNKIANNYNINIHAMDAQSALDFAKRNPEAFITPFLQNINRNGPVRSAIVGAF